MSPKQSFFYCRNDFHSPDDGLTVEAYGPADAAEEYAHQRDSLCSEYRDEQIVIVRDGDEFENWYRVTGQSVREYMASRVEAGTRD